MTSKNQNILADLQVQRLPSLPHVLLEMLDACQGTHASFQELSLIISKDAAIAARVVSLANSSFYNRGTTITSLERALFVLGTDTIKTIVITASIQQFFSGFNAAHAEYLKQFWRLSLSSALISKSLAILTSYPNPDEAYLTGLLHNIGELVLHTNYPKQFEKLQNSAQLEDQIKEELSLFGIDHAHVGSWLAHSWGLSDFASDAIEFHHAPAESIRDAHHLVKLTYLARLLSEKGALSNNATLDAAESLFELNASLVHEIVNKISAEVEDMAASLNIEIDTEDSQQDQAKQVELAKQVRNIGLLRTAAGELNRSNSKTELGRAFQNTLELLFGFKNSAVFWFNPAENDLSSIKPDHSENVPIKLKAEANRSIVSDAAIDLKLTSTFDTYSAEKDTPIVDQQIIRWLKSAGFICIPIASNGTLYCVLAVGINKPLDSQSNQYQLIQYFAEEIASTCADTLSNIRSNETNLSVQEMSLRAHEVAHEANNPLNIISNYLATLANKLNDNSEVQEELTILREEVERTGSILLRLKDLQNYQYESDDDTDINEEISRLTKLYNNSLFLAHNIACQLDLDDKLSPHPINRNSFRQVLTNLIKNAVEAQPEGGEVNIITNASINVNGGDFAEIRILDKGPGIENSVLKELFQPTTSTKGEGHSGLGLSITKNLITEAKGNISCRSGKDGTEFQILLPIKTHKT